MRALLNSAIVAVAAIAAPAFAQDAATGAKFTGPRIEAHVGYDNVRIGSGLGHADGVAYGVGAGYDFALGEGGTIAGVEVNADFTTADKFGIDVKRDLSALVRVGTSLGTNGLIYGKVGYSNVRLGFGGSAANGDGVRAGIGYELAFGGNAYGKIEYQYTNYEAGISRNQGLVGVGFRF